MFKIVWCGAISYTIALAILSLVNVDSVSKIGIDVSDKLVHVLAYALLTLIWFYALKISSIQLKLGILALSCIIYGIILEVIQGVITTHRQADFYDVVANIVGVLIVSTVLFIKNKR